MSDTIFALASGAGRAGVAVVRISGPGALKALSGLTSRSDTPPVARRATLRRVHDADGRPIDDALILWFPAPASFTGEDVAEVHVHGGRAVLDAVFFALAALGARPASPGEFSRRAFANGKLDLTQAEAIADLVDAETPAQRLQALGQLDGALSSLYETWRARLLDALALVEAEIDFPDEGDIPGLVARQAEPLLDSLERELAAALNDAQRGERIREGFAVTLMGAPNAGKSTLLNALSRSQAAIVTDIPGTTRDIIETRINVSGYVVSLADTAGLRAATDAIEREGVDRAERRARASDLRVLIVAPDAPAPAAALAQLKPDDLVWVNKADRFDAETLAATVPLSHDGSASHVKRLIGSAQSSEDVDRLRDALAAIVVERLSSSSAPAMTRARHRHGLTAAQAGLASARLRLADAPELAGADLRSAVRALESLVGRLDIEEVLDRIFSSFCVGK